MARRIYPHKIQVNIEKDLKELKYSLTIVDPTRDEEDDVGLTLDELIQLGFKPNRILVVYGESMDK